MKDFDRKYYERYGGLRRSEIAFWEKHQDQLDYMKSFLFCPCESIEGLHLLNSLGKQVFGVEYNEEIVKKCPLPKLIKQGDARRLVRTVADVSKFECIISFDLLEHFNVRDIIDTMGQFTCVAEMCVVIGICSTGHKWFYNDSSHITWWTYDTWKEVLSSAARIDNFELVYEDECEEIFIFKHFDERK
jgi:hypothetical protein